jgi:hypothetical protein
MHSSSSDLDRTRGVLILTGSICPSPLVAARAVWRGADDSFPLPFRGGAASAMLVRNRLGLCTQQDAQGEFLLITLSTTLKRLSTPTSACPLPPECSFCPLPSPVTEADLIQAFTHSLCCVLPDAGGSIVGPKSFVKTISTNGPDLALATLSSVTLGDTAPARAASSFSFRLVRYQFNLGIALNKEMKAASLPWLSSDRALVSMHLCGEEPTTAFALPRFAPMFLKGPANKEDVDPKRIADTWMALHHVVVPPNATYIMAAEAKEDGVGPLTPMPLSTLWHGPLTFKRTSSVAPFDVTLVRPTEHMSNTKQQSNTCFFHSRLTLIHRTTTHRLVLADTRQIWNALKLLGFDERTPALNQIDYTLSAPAALAAASEPSFLVSSSLGTGAAAARCASPARIQLQIPTKRAKVCVLMSATILVSCLKCTRLSMAFVHTCCHDMPVRPVPLPQWLCKFPICRYRRQQHQHRQHGYPLNQQFPRR